MPAASECYKITDLKGMKIRYVNYTLVASGGEFHENRLPISMELINGFFNVFVR